MSKIEITGLTFRYDGSVENIFESVSLRLDTDWKLGFTGRNGRGKTTFLKLLTGELSGAGSISSPISFDYFPFAVEAEADDAAEIATRLLPGCPHWRLVRELHMLEMDEEILSRPFATLSGGEKTKLLLAALFLKENNFLLIDEPTNHLDINARRLVGRYLNGKSGFILVSHDRAFLDGCVDHILSISKTGIELQKGNFSSFLENKRMRDETEQAANERLKKEVARLKEAARRTEKWSLATEKTKNSAVDSGYFGHKAAKMMKRSKSIEARRDKAADEKSALLRDVESAEQLAIHPAPYVKSTLAEVSAVSVLYGGRPVCENVSFTVKSGDRIAVSGRNGCGKTSLLRLFTGDRPDYAGGLRVGSGLTVSYLPQSTDFLKGSLKDFGASAGVDEALFLAILRKLDFPRAQFEIDMEHYSAGQKKKVLLARSLCQSANLYVWDEPLNYIDVISRMQIERLIVEGKPTMLFVEHDKYFSDAVSTRAFDL